MSDATSVNAAAMAAGLDDLRKAYTNLRSALDALTGELNSSLANWDGEAKNVYHDAQAKWNAACDHMAAVIEKMQTVLGQITEGYDTTERGIQSRFGGAL